MSPTTKTVLKTSLCLPLIIGLAHCGKADDKTKQVTASSVSYPYDVSVAFTPAAIAAIRKAGVGAVVDAYYFGAPTADAQSKANDSGEIELGQDLAEIDAQAQAVHFTGKGIVVDSLKAVQGMPSVEVRVYSGTTQDNVLSCNTFRDTVAAAQAKPVAIACDVKSHAATRAKKRM